MSGLAELDSVKAKGKPWSRTLNSVGTSLEMEQPSDSSELFAATVLLQNSADPNPMQYKADQQ